MKQIVDLIKDIEVFGLLNGIKIKVITVCARFSGEKKEHFVKVKKINHKIFLRQNTMDISLAKCLLGKAGEYDFLLDKPMENVKVIIDAGANIGLFSVLMAYAYPQCRIISIEPEKENANILSKNLQIMCLDKATVLMSGLWNKECKLSLESRDTGEVGFVVKEAENGNIDAVSLGGLINKFKIDLIDILKIDIEGSEYEVFDSSAEEWIDKVRCLIIETHDRFREGCSKRVDEMMTKHKYKHTRYGENDVYYK